MCLDPLTSHTLHYLNNIYVYHIYIYNLPSLRPPFYGEAYVPMAVLAREFSHNHPTSSSSLEAVSPDMAAACAASIFLGSHENPVKP